MQRILSLKLFFCVLVCALLLTGRSVKADEQFMPQGVLKVCSDPNNLPFSNQKGEGFENKIAELFAQKLGWKLEYVYFPQRMGFIRNTLRFKLPGESYRCDLVMGIPADYDQAAPTRPYFHSAYAIVLSSEKAAATIRSEAQFLALPKGLLESLKIGVQVKSPGALWLMQNGLLEQAVAYRLLNADPAYYAGEIIERDLANGKIDAALMWGPVAGFFASRVMSKPLSVIPLHSVIGNQLAFGIAMGVRHEDREWKATVQKLIDANQAEILSILRHYHVPLQDQQQAQHLMLTESQNNKD